MNLNPFTKPETFTDEALDEIAADVELKKAALAERERRIEERRLAAEEEARERAEAERRAKVAALLHEHEQLAEEAANVTAAVGAGVVGLASAVEKRDELISRARVIEVEIRSEGVPAPPLSLTFTPEAMAAGRRVARLIDREMTESPFASAARNNPDAFRR